MPDNVYEIIALGARYWFAFLGVLIVLRSFFWLHRDRAAKHRRLKQLPDAGMIGEFVVLSGSEELPEGSFLPVPWEGTIGFVRGCDVVVPVKGVRAVQADVEFENGRGLAVIPRFRRPVIIDGETVSRRWEADGRRMVHGSVLQIGEAVLQLQVFMGHGMERRAKFIENSQSTDYPDPGMSCEAGPVPGTLRAEDPADQPAAQGQRPHRRRVRGDGEDDG